MIYFTLNFKKKTQASFKFMTGVRNLFISANYNFFPTQITCTVTGDENA